MDPQGNIEGECPRCGHEYEVKCWEDGECFKCGLHYEGQYGYNGLLCWLYWDSFE